MKRSENAYLVLCCDDAPVARCHEVSPNRVSIFRIARKTLHTRVRPPIRRRTNRRGVAAVAASHHALCAKLDVLPGILPAGRWSCLNSRRPTLRAGKGPARRRWTRHRLCSALRLTQPPCPRVAWGAGSAPIRLPGAGAPSGDWGLQRRTAPPAVHRPAWGLVRWTGQRAERPRPTPCRSAMSRLLYVYALSRADCAPLDCVSRAAMPRIGRGLRPRHRLRRHGGATADLPDCPAQARATLRQPARQTRPSALRAYSPGPCRAAASVRDLACLAFRLASKLAQGETLRKNGGTSNTPPRTPKPGTGKAGSTSRNPVSFERSKHET